MNELSFQTESKINFNRTAFKISASGYYTQDVDTVSSLSHLYVYANVLAYQNLYRRLDLQIEGVEGEKIAFPLVGQGVNGGLGSTNGWDFLTQGSEGKFGDVNMRYGFSNDMRNTVHSPLPVIRAGCAFGTVTMTPYYFCLTTKKVSIVIDATISSLYVLGFLGVLQSSNKLH